MTLPRVGKHAETVAGGGSWDQAAGVAVQADDKIVAVGSTWSGNGDFAVVRYGADGSLDVSFGTAGKVTTDFAGSVDYASSVAIQSDGKIVVAGTSYNGSDDDFAVVRYNTDGTLDNQFRHGRQSNHRFRREIRQRPERRHSIRRKDCGGGAIRLTVTTRISPWCVTNADGTLDTSFGTGGKVITDIAGCNDQAYSVVIQSDGKIVVAGTSNNGSDDDFAVVRYNADGTLDNSFGSSGKATTDLFGRADRARSVVLQTNGQIVVAGSTDNGANDDFRRGTL